VIVAFDPGRNIGVAVVTETGDLSWCAVIDTAGLKTIDIPQGATVLVGNGTGSSELVARLEALSHRVELVGEGSTSLEARSLYFSHHPPRGWQRLLPGGMRSPPRPIDDYAAYAIALRWLRGVEQ
jgi:hypothetical protein